MVLMKGLSPACFTCYSLVDQTVPLRCSFGNEY